METNETCFISIGHRLIIKYETDEEDMPEGNKRGKVNNIALGRENCRSREGSTEESPSAEHVLVLID